MKKRRVKTLLGEQKQMGKTNPETTLKNTINKRYRYLDKSTNKLFQLKVCLDVLHEQGEDCDVIEHFYEVELRHNKRLSDLINK